MDLIETKTTLIDMENFNLPEYILYDMDSISIDNGNIVLKNIKNTYLIVFQSVVERKVILGHVSTIAPRSDDVVDLQSFINYCYSLLIKGRRFNDQSKSYLSYLIKNYSVNEGD